MPTSHSVGVIVKTMLSLCSQEPKVTSLSRLEAKYLLLFFFPFSTPSGFTVLPSEPQIHGLTWHSCLPGNCDCGLNIPYRVKLKVVSINPSGNQNCPPLLLGYQWLKLYPQQCREVTRHLSRMKLSHVLLEELIFLINGVL